MAARNITKEFITRLIDNGQTAEGWRPSKKSVGIGAVVGLVTGVGALAGAVGGWGAPKANTFGRFYLKVRAGGDWDFKDNWLQGDEEDGVEVAGRGPYRNDMPGNFHYGFVGAAAGISDWMLYSQAGAAQRRAGTSKPEYWCTDGDDPRDQEFIRLGIKLYDDNGLSVTETNLKVVLGLFSAKECGPEPADYELMGP